MKLNRKNLTKKLAIEIVSSSDCECETGHDCLFCISLILLGDHAEWRLKRGSDTLYRVKPSPITGKALWLRVQGHRIEDILRATIEPTGKLKIEGFKGPKGAYTIEGDLKNEGVLKKQKIQLTKNGLGMVKL